MKDFDVQSFINETRITEVKLDECFQQQSSLRAYYGAKAVEAESYANKLKAAFEVGEARLYKEYRENALKNGEKATEKSIENAVKTDSRWLNGKKKLIDAQAMADLMKVCVASLMDRKDMLIQIGADRRGDKAGQMRMLALQQEEQQRLEQLRSTAKAIYPSAL